MEKISPYVLYEKEETKGELAWKADYTQFVSKAFSTYGNDYGKTALCIYQYLTQAYKDKKWLVFAYSQGKVSSWSQGKHVCELGIKTGTTLHKFYACAYDNSGFLSKELAVSSAYADDNKAILVEKGVIDEQVLYYFYGRSLLANGKVDTKAIRQQLKQDGGKLGIGDSWTILECTNGGFAGHYIEGYYAIFQLKTKVYLNIRVR